MQAWSWLQPAWGKTWEQRKDCFLEQLVGPMGFFKNYLIIAFKIFKIYLFAYLFIYLVSYLLFIILV